MPGGRRRVKFQCECCREVALSWVNRGTNVAAVFCGAKYDSIRDLWADINPSLSRNAFQNRLRHGRCLRRPAGKLQRYQLVLNPDKNTMLCNQFLLAPVVRK